MPRPTIQIPTLWRSPFFGSFVLGTLLILGIPLFLCMPPWCDVTLYDLAVRNILRGGVHYRDLFDTNLPGIDWIMLAIRATCGWSYEVLRAWDLAFVGVAVGLMYRILRIMDLSLGVRLWFLVGASLFYLFQCEYVHCQRDVWMLLPTMLACSVRLSTTLKSTPATNRSVFLRALIEGMLWGCAVWIKPHVIVPGIAIWLMSQLMQRKYHRVSWQSHIFDAVGMILGGGIVGVAGITWLVQSGTWPHFWTILMEWNPEYLTNSWSTLHKRILSSFQYFEYWSALQNLAIPVACLMIWDAVQGPSDRPWHQRFAVGRWLYNPPKTQQQAIIAGFVAVLYLTWFLQALLLQQLIDYVHVPEVFLALLVLSMQRWAYAFFSLLWFSISTLLVGQYGSATEWTPIDDFNSVLPAIRLSSHPLLDTEVLKAWPRCFTEGGTARQWDCLSHYGQIQCGTEWQDLSNVADYLDHETDVGDYEVTCWNDGTHPLYLMLSIEPSTRYMHFGTVFRLRSKIDQIRDDVVTSHQRYVVSDLRFMTHDYSQSQILGPGDDPLKLPAWFPVSQRSQFPWNLPIVYRSGRYLVHRVDEPPDPATIDIPSYDETDDLGPGLNE